MTQETVEVSMYNWGPCIIKVKITDEFKRLLLEEANKNSYDYRKNLAGNIEKETGYSNEARKKIIPYLEKYLNVYDQAFEKYQKRRYSKPPKYMLSGLWVNFQKANEFNPPHDHDGKLSFVIYVSIPEELREENKKYLGRSCGPGGIQFLYGEGRNDCITEMSYFPEEKDMFIFPAWLKHWVNPYQSDCIRISVSGNFHDSTQLNNLD